MTTNKPATIVTTETNSGPVTISVYPDNATTPDGTSSITISFKQGETDVVIGSPAAQLDDTSNIPVTPIEQPEAAEQEPTLSTAPTDTVPATTLA